MKKKTKRILEANEVPRCDYKLRRVRQIVIDLSKYDLKAHGFNEYDVRRFSHMGGANDPADALFHFLALWIKDEKKDPLWRKTFGEYKQ